MKIEFDNVSFKYDKKAPYALKNVNLTINDGEMVFLLGHSGSGKSTLLGLINGLNFTKEGIVKITNEHLEYLINKKSKNIQDVRKNVGFIFQIPENQLFESTVLKDVMFGPENFNYKEQKAKELSIDALEKMNIKEECYDKSPFKLSGGEKRKVALAGILSYKPHILLLDEPTSSLDMKSSKELFNVLQELKKSGNIIIIASHNENLAYKYADKIIILNKGNATYFDNYKEAFNDKELLNETNIEIPFVKRIQNELNLKGEIRDIKELALKIKEAN